MDSSRAIFFVAADAGEAQSGEVAVAHGIFMHDMPPEHWRSCADEARKLGMLLGDMTARGVMLDIALTYEGMARKVARKGDDQASE